MRALERTKHLVKRVITPRFIKMALVSFFMIEIFDIALEVFDTHEIKPTIYRLAVLVGKEGVNVVSEVVREEI